MPIRQLLPWGFLTASLVCLAGLARAAEKPLETMPFVDLQKYQGVWYEIARFPHSFEKGCACATAEYRIIAPDRVSVLNRCLTASGETRDIAGHATVVDRQSNAKLEVVFDNWFFKLFSWLVKGKYWIMYVDPDYRPAIVGAPGRTYLWILAREPRLDDSVYLDLVERCRQQGFAVEKLIRNTCR